MKQKEWESKCALIENGTGHTVRHVRTMHVNGNKTGGVSILLPIVTLSDEDEKEYTIKQLRMSQSRVEEYRTLCSMNLEGLQKIPYIIPCGVQNYLILSEWIQGETLEHIILRGDTSYKSLASAAACRLRSVHQNMVVREHITITDDDLRNLIFFDYLSKSTEQMLFEYMSHLLPYVNARNHSIVHGDMHVGNMLLTDHGKIVFIDLDDITCGDPFLDMTYAANIIFNNRLQRFYHDFIIAYFDGKLPEHFWPVVNFYSIAKAIIIIKHELRSYQGKTLLSMERLIAEHKGLQQDEPEWFRAICKRQENNI